MLMGNVHTPAFCIEHCMADVITMLNALIDILVLPP